MEQTDDDLLTVTAFSSEHAHELLLEQREIASSYNGTLMNGFAENRKFPANKTNNKFYHKRTSKRVEQAKRKARSGYFII